MIRFIIVKTIKDYRNTDKPSVREAYGVMSGIVGIFCNLFLFGLKVTIGLLTGSIAILSDGVNNLSDTGSSVVSVIGAKLSGRDADVEHPYGHGRFEYVASLIISFLIMMVGFELFKESISKIRNPEIIVISIKMALILVLSIGIKVWMFSYNRYIGRLIDSSMNRAAAADSLNDVIATSAVIIATLAGAYFKVPLDGYAGIIVSCLIMYTGFGVAKETVSLLLGMSPSEETVEKIMTIIKSCDDIRGAHDLKVHDYGPGRSIASIHTELSNKTDIVKAHMIIDRLEKQVMKELGIELVIHVDPIGEGEIGPID